MKERPHITDTYSLKPPPTNPLTQTHPHPHTYTFTHQLLPLLPLLRDFSTTPGTTPGVARQRPSGTNSTQRERERRKQTETDGTETDTDTGQEPRLCMQVRTHTHAHTHTHTQCMYLCMHACPYIYESKSYVYTSPRATSPRATRPLGLVHLLLFCTHRCPVLCVYVCACVCMCVHVCVCVYQSHIEAEGGPHPTPRAHAR